MKIPLSTLMVFAGGIASVLAVDIEDQAIAVAYNRAPVQNISETDRGLLRVYLQTVNQKQGQLDSKGRTIDWNAAQGALIELGDDETIDKVAAMFTSPDFGDRGRAALIVATRSQPLLIPKLGSTVRLNRWKTERVEDIMFGGASRTALRAMEHVLAKSTSFSETVRRWAQRTPFSEKKPDQATAAFDAWWTQNQPHFEAKRYDLVKPLQE